MGVTSTTTLVVDSSDLDRCERQNLAAGRVGEGPSRALTQVCTPTHAIATRGIACGSSDSTTRGT